VTDTQKTEVTRLLAALRAGDAQAGERLFPLVYDELRRAASRLLSGERKGHTLNSTDLVHEAWLRLGLSPNDGASPLPAEDRAHFLGLTIRAMRHVLVDHARRRDAGKRGGGAVRVTLGERDGANLTSPEGLIALFDAIEKLGAVDERMRRVVEYRYLVGLTEDETAAALNVTTRTVQRDWTKARAWLYRQLYASETMA
jgi:RNA polymerase sigma factor (TIGR02999 family)